MSVKVFTLAEANRLLPQVQEAILWFRATVLQIVELQDSVGVLGMIGAHDPVSPEHREFEDKRARMDELVETYNRRLEEFTEIGCLIKDLDTGLVDFYGEKEGRLIFLCWRLGEESIAYWHEVNSGFAGRHSVDKL